MAARHSNRRPHSAADVPPPGCSPIPAAAYYRMSSDRQETSIRDQQKAVAEYAEHHGYNIVATYQDEGVSGWKDRERKQFQRLIADAESGKFQAVLCWDQDRFSRFPMLEANHYWFLLQRAGVHIATVAQGRLNFEDLGEYLKATITQHGKAEFCRDNSRNICRGMRPVMLQGKWITAVPLGYRKGPEGFLEPGEPRDVELVQRIFRMRLAGDGYVGIAKVLNAERIKPPRAESWSGTAIYAMLHRETYIGNAVIGKGGRGRFNRVVEEPVTIEGVHPAIIDRRTWEGVQRINQQRQRGKPNGHSKQAPLTGLLFCGRCNSRMYSTRRRECRYYLCSEYHAKGRCAHCAIRQEKALAMVANKLRDEVLLGEPGRLEEAIQRVLTRRAAGPPAGQKRAIEQRLGAVEEQIGKATTRLVSVDEALVPAIEAKLLELHRDRDELRAKLQAVEPPRPKRHDAKQIAAKLWKLDELLRHGNPQRVRAALAQIVDRIVLDYRKGERNGRGQTYQFTGGTIHLVDQISTSLCRTSCSSWLPLTALRLTSPSTLPWPASVSG